MVGVLAEAFEVRPAEQQVGLVGERRGPEARGGRDGLVEPPLVVELAGELETTLGTRRDGESDAQKHRQRHRCANPLQSMDLCVFTARHLI